MEASTIQLLVLTLAVAIVTLQVVKWWLQHRRFYDLAAKFEQPPGYSCYPLLGHAHHYANLEDIIKIATSFTSPFGVVFLGTKVFYTLNTPELLEECMTSDICLNKPDYLQVLKHVDGGIFLAEGATWKRQRKLLNAGFKQRILNFYAAKFSAHDQRFLRQLTLRVGQLFDINILSEKLSFQKYFDCAFGLNFDSRSEEYLHALNGSVSLCQARIFSLFECVNIMNKVVRHREFDQCLKTLTRITEEIVVERRKIMEETPGDGVDGDAECEELIFIDYLLQCIGNEKYDEKKLVPELITFIFAAIDTCSATFSYMCLCLGMHPEIQEKVYEEICEVIGDRPFHHSDYNRLPYLHMVLKETMRIFPTGPILHRQASDEVKLGDYVFPKGSVLHLNIINVHRSPAYYKDPMKFAPERFAPDSEECRNRHRFAFVPFSGGKRTCIGERFGMLSLVSTAATVLRQFRIETTYATIEDVRVEQKFTLAAVGGYPVRLYHRK